ncbi:ABC transporter substrate-binding protein [Acetobacter sp. TBRC 12305]|uniref:ABC transporter substrate-binding protein n=1 Tax=Acetobacter garciniae TaxID=2817435 RepID=A0A939HP99_9PROT|nr:ABC transporter substrate-binding protein [Acetobacter garciniae]MBO1325574.1 ABC transporter substrate-binding protein [Acetobacter garciniae]MBX0345253.1 ABC transporter substrate-binding protein [Acetobacter garciniae]
MSDRLSPSSPAVSSIWYTRCPVPTATGIALEKGWLAASFREQGIELRSLRDSPEEHVRSAHFNHHLFGLFREGGNIPAIWARARGQDTVVVGLTWVDEAQFILVRPESPIFSVADLAGKSLALPTRPDDTIDFARAMALHGYVSVLASEGLTLDDVTIREIKAGPTRFAQSGGDTRPWRDVIADALLSGQADAIYTKGAQAVALQREHGLRIIADINAFTDKTLKINNGTPRPVTVDRLFARTRPDLVARYLAVLQRAALWAKTHEQQVFEIVGRETSTTASAAQAAYGAGLPHSLEIRLNPEWINALEIQKNFLLQHGFLKADFDIHSWIDARPLQEAATLALSA